MLTVENIHKNFGAYSILKGISVQFKMGIINLIIGGSGSGKTTLLKCMVGLYEPDQGTVCYNRYNFTHMNVKERMVIRKQIGMLFQSAALFDSMTVEGNVLFPLDLFTTMTRSEKLARVNFCLEKVQLAGKNKLSPSELSGGMKKRVGIARAIVMQPKYLFCDEPNSGLDPKTAIVIDELVQTITAEYSMTTVVITHDMNSVRTIGDHIIFLHQGKKWWEGSNKDIKHADNKELNEFVFAK